MPLHVEIVAAERSVFSETVDEVLATTPLGQVGILPRHAPLLTLLVPGELRLKRGTAETVMSISGGFLEVNKNQVVILADAAERADDIDLARAEEARQRALARLAARSPDVDYERAQIALQRAVGRLHVAGRVRRSRGVGQPTLPRTTDGAGL